MTVVRRAVGPLLVLLAIAAALGCGDDDPKLKVTNLSPDKGDSDGGTYVVIKGNRFIKDGPRNAKIYFGSRQGTVVRFASDTELIVEAPGGKANEKADVLIIFEPGGELKIPNGFTWIEKSNAGPTMDQLDTSKVKK